MEKLPKDQRELIDTYFAKRLKITENSPETKAVYEVQYMLGHPEMFDLQKIRMSSADWLDDIIKHPENIPSYNFVYNDQRFRYRVTELLEYFPKFMDLVDLSTISESDTMNLIISTPGIITKIPKEILNGLDSWRLSAVLHIRPQLVDYFDVRKIEAWSMESLMPLIPSAAARYPMEKFGAHSIGYMISKNPEILRYYDIRKALDKEGKKSTYGSIISTAVVENPHILSKILKDPELRQYFDPQNIDPYYRKQILSKFPALVKVFHPETWDPYDIMAFIKKNPRYHEYFDLNRISPIYYDDIIIEHPELAKYINLSNVYTDDIYKILSARPELIEIFLKNRMKNINGREIDIFKGLYLAQLRNLIKSHPELKPYLKKYIIYRKWIRGN